MNFTLTFDNLEGQLQNAFRDLPNRPTAKRQMLGAMAARFKFLCLQNLGATGTDRPHAWKPLTKPYAARVGRAYATLDLNGRLMRSIRVRVSDDESSVYVDPDDCIYAARHQWGDDGGKPMPARPFFPMTDAGLTPQAEAEVIQAAQDMLTKSLAGNYIGPIY